MELLIDNYKIYYEKHGDNVEKPPVLLLHGWGTSIRSFDPVIGFLSQTHSVYALDFPGFGESPDPEEPIDTYAYADITEKFMEALKLHKPIVMGHSFGGRVSIILASRMEFSNLVLIDAAGVKPPRSMGYFFRIYSYKFMKAFCSLPLIRGIYGEFLDAYRSNAGSEDYKSATQTMKRILSIVVNQDLQKHMPMIKAPTLLVWGELDDATPVSDAKIMESRIKGSGLVVLKGAGHYSYLDRFDQFKAVISSFLGI